MIDRALGTTSQSSIPNQDGVNKRSVCCMRMEGWEGVQQIQPWHGQGTVGYVPKRLIVGTIRACPNDVFAAPAIG